MYKELKERWIKALRSGQYTQGKMQLQTEAGKFCCMGVLCDLISQYAWGHITVPRSDEPIKAWSSATGWHTGYPPTELLPMVTSNRLSDLNDDEEATFAEIADFIEANMTDQGDLTNLY